MASGIRATVTFTAAGGCPMLARAPGGGTSIDGATSNVVAEAGTPAVTDFSTSVDLDPDDDLTPLFTGGGANWYRLEREEGLGCPCQCLGEFGVPVARYTVRDGRLTLVFYATGYEQLKAVIAELRERYPDVDIRRFVRSPTEDASGDTLFVDRGRLTARQLEVMRTALDMGYFERPRRANATDVADALDINPSTFSEHLASAQRKLFEEILERGR